MMVEKTSLLELGGVGDMSSTCDALPMMTQCGYCLSVVCLKK